MPTIYSILATTALFLAAVGAFVSLSSCGVNLAEQYRSPGYRPGIDYKTLAPEELPEVCRTEDMIGSLMQYEQLGYVSIGRMSFCGKFPNLTELQEFAAAQGAQVVLYSSKENGKIECTTQALGGRAYPEPAPVLDSYDQEYEVPLQAMFHLGCHSRKNGT